MDNLKWGAPMAVNTKYPYKDTKSLIQQLFNEGKNCWEIALVLNMNPEEVIDIADQE